MHPDYPAPRLALKACHEFNDQEMYDHWLFFIEGQLLELRDYDALRPKGHVYEFDTHSQRVAYLMDIFAQYLGWGDEMANMLYWATLPHDIGKKSLPVHIWDSVEKPTKEEKSLRRTHVAEGLKIIKDELSDEALETSFARILLEIMENHHEALDGSGLFGKSADHIQLLSRMSAICDSFDGWGVERPHFGDRDISINGVLTRMETEKQGQFDEELLKLFRQMLSHYFQTDQNFVQEYNKYKDEGDLPDGEVYSS
jgi:HD-GYP domain-containing protein (c-di-GMP phosphodiesterase class II)